MRLAGRQNRSSNESWLRSRHASGRAPDRAAPFCARRRDMGAHHGGIEHLHQMRRLAHCRQRIEESFESSGPAQAPEPLPDAVPMPKLFWESPPSDVVNHEILQGFEKLSVVPSLVAAPRARCLEYLQNNRPVLFRHGGQHGRSSKNRLPMSQRKSDSGIPLPYTWLNPSTRPSITVAFSF